MGLSCLDLVGKSAKEEDTAIVLEEGGLPLTGGGEVGHAPEGGEVEGVEAGDVCGAEGRKGRSEGGGKGGGV